MQKFRTGDLLLWRSTVFYDLLGEYSLRIGALHVSMIFVGKEFEKYSVCGASPSGTYVTFQIKNIYPIEEVIGHIWSKPNGSACYVLRRSLPDKQKRPRMLSCIKEGGEGRERRQAGADIPSELAIQIYEEYKKLDQVSPFRTTKLAIYAYLGIGYIEDDPIQTKTNFGLCPWFVGYLLAKMGCLHSKADINSLLPYDYLELQFYQRETYVKEEIFNKETLSLSWFMAAPLVSWGLISPEPQVNENVEKILGDYNFPRYSGNLR